MSRRQFLIGGMGALAVGATFLSLGGARRLADGFFRKATLHLMFHGDSITHGDGVDSSVAFPSGLSEALSKSGIVARTTIRGVNGQGWDYAWPSSGVAESLTREAATQIDAMRKSGMDERLILFAGTNDIALGGSSGEQTMKFLAGYLEGRIAAGWDTRKVIVCTMLPREGVEAERANYNGAIVSAASTYHYRVCRLDLVEGLGRHGDNYGPNYVDGIHPNAAGHLLIVNALLPLVREGALGRKHVDEDDLDEPDQPPANFAGSDRTIAPDTERSPDAGEIRAYRRFGYRAILRRLHRDGVPSGLLVLGARG